MRLSVETCQFESSLADWLADDEAIKSYAIGKKPIKVWKVDNLAQIFPSLPQALFLAKQTYLQRDFTSSKQTTHLFVSLQQPIKLRIVSKQIDWDVNGDAQVIIRFSD